MTSGPGCKIAPVSPAPGAFVFVKTGCGRHRILQSVRLSSEGRELNEPLGTVSDVSLSPNASLIGALVEGVNRSSVFLIDLKRRTRPRLVLTAQKVGHPGRIWLTPSNGELLLLLGTKLLWLRNGGTCQLHDLHSPFPTRPPLTACAPLDSETASLIDLQG